MQEIEISDKGMKNTIFTKTTTFQLKGLDDLVHKFSKEYADAQNPLSPNILGIGIGLDEICNFKCAYCYAGQIGLLETDVKNTVLTKNGYNKLIKDASKLGARAVVICGNGEPFVSEMIIDIIKESHANNMSTIVFTNGSIFGDDDLCMKIHKMTSHELLTLLKSHNISIIVKCDSIDPKKYEDLTGGKFQIFLNAVNNIKKYFLTIDNKCGVVYTNTGFSMVITRDTFKEIPEISKFADEANFQFVCKFPSFMGNAAENKEIFFTPEEATEKYFQTFDYIDKRETMLIDDKYCLINQLGISINNKGIPLLCLSSREMDKTEKISILNTSLTDIVLQRKLVSPPVLGDCPKKSQWYSFKKVSETGPTHSIIDDLHPHTESLSIWSSQCKIPTVIENKI